MEIQQVEELKRQILASQQKVEELAKENGNLHHKVQDLTKENEQQKQDFERRIANLQQENEEILKGLGKNKKLAEEEEQQIMLPMHEHDMKVQLPLENWFDLLEFVPRRQLGNIAYEVGDRQFARILQSFLHEHGEIALGRMEIIRPRYKVTRDRPMLQLGHYPYQYAPMDLPDRPMSENVKNFEEINIDYVDMSVLDFLRKFKENSLLTNVNLYIEDVLKDQMLPILNKILPLFSSIYSIYFYDNWLNNNDEEFQLLLKTVVAQARILSIRWDYLGYNWRDAITLENEMNWCCSLLYSPRDDGMPRALVTEHGFQEPNHCASFICRIKKDFKTANHAVRFYIRLTIGYFGDQAVPKNILKEMTLNNNKTNEKLVLKAGVSDKNILLISRHSSTTAKHEIEEYEKELLECMNYRGNKLIYIDRLFDLNI